MRRREMEETRGGRREVRKGCNKERKKSNEEGKRESNVKRGRNELGEEGEGGKEGRRLGREEGREELSERSREGMEGGLWRRGRELDINIMVNKVIKEPRRQPFPASVNTR